MSGRATRRMAPSSGGPSPIKTLEMQEFGRRLHDIRSQNGMNQSDLARAVWGEHTGPDGKKSAKNRDRISQYEKGQSFPDPHNLARLAEALGVAPEVLAPDVVAATVDHENPAIQVTAVNGHFDKVHLRVNLLTSMVVAAKVLALLTPSLEG